MATGERLIETAIHAILEGVKLQLAEGEQSIKDVHLLALRCLCGANLLPALDILDKGGVELHISPSGRTAYIVRGSSRNTYLCLKAERFCSCLSFQYTVLNKHDSVMCKHLLAVHVAEAIGSAVIQEVSDEDLAECLKLSVSSYLPNTQVDWQQHDSCNDVTKTNQYHTHTHICLIVLIMSKKMHVVWERTM